MSARLLLGLLLLFVGLRLDAAYRVEHPTVEMAVDPLGVDVAQPRFSWRIASEESGQRQTAWQVLAAASPEALAAGRGDVWDSGRVEGDQTVAVPYAGRALRSSERVFWTVRSWDRDGRASDWSAPATWTMGLLAPDDWRAKWITSAGTERLENTLLRREFTVKPGLRRALVHVSGLGQYELFLNGAKAGVDVLSPGWTNYKETILYDTRDVTALLREGANAAGLSLGNGMFHVARPEGRFAKFKGSFGPQRAILQLRLEYADGAVETVLTDETWKTHAGPITFSSIYGGEDFDARLVQAGWDRPGFADAGWTPAAVFSGESGVLRGQSHEAEPLARIETRAVVATRELAPGVVLYDFGQNASFMPRVTVSGPAGSVVKLTAGEVVKEDGTIERGTMGGAHRGSAWWQYTKSTDGEETWFPQFYYVGSRYLYAEMMSAKEGEAKPAITSVEMVIVHSAAEPLGHFAASNPLLGRIRDLVRWAQRSNMVSVLTDCPHREKLGWIEQYHLNGPSIRYEFDVARIYAKGMNDMAEAQTAEGLIPNIAPEYTQFKGAFRDAAEWGAAFVLVPWQQYDFTGDPALLREHYDQMKRYFAYLETQAKDDILSNGLGDWFDYELGKGKRADLTPAPITATAFFYEDARRLAAAAELLGHKDDAAHFAERAARIRQAYVAKFRREDGLYGTASQASLAIPIVMGLVEEKDRAGVLAALVADVEAKGYASAGDIAFRYLLLALSQAGRSDVIYKLINQDEKPGYGFQLKQGATALAESWHASLGASHNHFMLGQVIEWFYADLVGIAPDPAAPGFKNVIIRPQPVGDLTWVEGSYASVHGPVSVRWDHLDGKFTLKVTIPANTTATVYLPSRVEHPVADSEQVTWLRREGDRSVYRIESGSHVLESVW
jgi:alpha-L-rhamnosidase